MMESLLNLYNYAMMTRHHYEEGYSPSPSTTKAKIFNFDQHHHRHCDIPSLSHHILITTKHIAMRKIETSPWKSLSSLLPVHVLHPLQHAADVVEIKSLTAQSGCKVFEILCRRWG